ncbi:MAG: riboflavin synthase subunit alpha [Betaproteobacteria bacterium]
MFTGIVQGVGRIERVEALGADAGVRLTVDAQSVPLAGARVGDSIALNGACMTITSLAGQRFTVDVSRESLARTVGLDAPGEVNLETALALGDKLGGHLVSGHVDGVGEVVRFAPVGESWDLVVRAPRELAKYFAYKGSVAVDGVSLTVNRVTDTAAGCELAINLIPHTIEVTTLKRLAPGARVNLEVDLIARYVERMLAATTAAGA